MLKLTLLISGHLGFELLQHLFNNSTIKIVSVFTDYKSKEIIEYSEKNKIKIFKGNPRKKKDKVLLFLYDVGETDLTFSINYLFIIEKVLIDYPKLYTLNVHGSLLPKYRGRTPHVWSIINGEDSTGVTVHKINEGIDTGDILLQKEVKINFNETGADILNKFNLIYPTIVDESLNIIRQDICNFRCQDETKATYFGKRTPADGEINWNWSKERIYNWVRAQSKPYPGAFTYYKNQKIIIDKIKFSDYGFNFEIENGTIIDKSNVIIKTPNGAMQIIDYRFKGNENSFEKDIILG